jgi:membrane associated rhomboid family serine protease
MRASLARGPVRGKVDERPSVPPLNSHGGAPIIGFPAWRSRRLVASRMPVATPDPAYTASPQAHANFGLAVKLALAFVALIWLLQLANWALDTPPLGVRPRTLAGLAGILFAPISHVDFGHLVANSAPLVVLLVALLHLYPRSTPVVLPLLYLGPGVAVWLLGRDALHAGASGLVYGLTAHVFVAGLLRRDRRALAASLGVAFLYGYTIWGVLPLRVADSWETHLAGTLIGIVLALALRHRDLLPTVTYPWEGEETDPELAQRAVDEAEEATMSTVREPPR